mgnify:CR=1 FL=1
MDVFEQYKTAQKAGWAHFAPLQMITTQPAARLVRFAGVRAGDRVLDVACGTGVVAVTAARAGAAATGIDITPELVREAHENGRTAGVSIDWHEGDVEAMPFADASFDVVLSQFGHMFAPRPERAVSEMLRVLRPGGTIAFATWPPELFVGRMFALVARYMPPLPSEIAPPPAWGDPAVVRHRLGSDVRDLVFDRDTMAVATLSLAHFRRLTERTAGPVLRLVEMLGQTDLDRLAAFRREYDALADEYYDGNVLRQGYLLARGLRAAGP